jgi:hypothetical protein
MLATAAGGGFVGFAEGRSAAGAFGLFAASSAPSTGSSVGRDVYELGVSRNGSQLALPTSAGLRIYGADLTLTDSIGGANDAALAVAFHPRLDRFYVSWARATDGIEAYSAETLQKLSTLDDTPNLPWVNGEAFVQGRLRIARDGSFLFATLRAGIGVYPL